MGEGSPPRCLVGRQTYAHAGAAAVRPIRYVDLPTVTPHDLACDRQPETTAAGGGVGRTVEAVKNVGNFVGGDTAAVVFNDDMNAGCILRGITERLQVDMAVLFCVYSFFNSIKRCSNCACISVYSG